MMETIKQRYSVRNYLDKTIEKEKIREIMDFINLNEIGPFGNRVRFEIIDTTEFDKEELKSLGTYGMIKGGDIYIAGIVKKSENNFEDFGYCMEKVILKLTQIGLGSCWMGGTFNRSNFAKKINLKDDELLPAVTPIGYIADKKTFKENLIRTIIGAKKRKPSQELFFDVNSSTPLDLTTIGEYADILEAVRLGPSASNKQPWCVIRDKEGNYHLYLNENEAYNNAIPEIKIQNIDMGIAMCHFELVAKELSINGKWIKSKTSIDSGKLIYIAMWKVS